jgi:hypothetical protein
MKVRSKQISSNINTIDEIGPRDVADSMAAAPTTAYPQATAVNLHNRACRC